MTGDARGEQRARITTVHGVLAEPSLVLDNARAIAITGNEVRYWTFLNRNGEFTLQLPVGESYRIVFANQLAAGGQVKFGHLSVDASAGKSEWLGANQPGVVELGNIALDPKEAKNDPTSEGWNRPDERDSKDPNGGWTAPPGEGDWACHKDDSVARDRENESGNWGEKRDGDDANEAGGWNGSGTDTRCNVCNAGANKPLFPSKEPGGSWGDRDETHRKPNAPWDDDKTCSSGGHVGNAPDAEGKPGSEGDGWTSGPGGWTSGQDGNQGGWNPGMPSSPNGPTRPPESEGGQWTSGADSSGGWMGGQSGGNGAGVRCASALECAANLSCIAGMCQAKPR